MIGKIFFFLTLFRMVWELKVSSCHMKLPNKGSCQCVTHKSGPSLHDKSIRVLLVGEDVDIQNFIIHLVSLLRNSIFRSKFEVLLPNEYRLCLLQSTIPNMSLRGVFEARAESGLSLIQFLKSRPRPGPGLEVSDMSDANQGVIS